MVATLIAAFAAIIASVVTIFVTKREEREAIWRAKKLAYYEEFFGAASGIVDKSTPREAQTRFSNAVNNLHLIASPGVIRALHEFCEQIKVSNLDRSQERHDKLWSRLVWEIRSDLNDPPSDRPDDFRAMLWSSGVENSTRSQ